MKPPKAKCPSCGAAIVWADCGGKAIPLNWTRARAYVVCVAEGKTIAEEDPSLVHISHFLTCPNVSQHSRGAN